MWRNVYLRPCGSWWVCPSPYASKEDAVRQRAPFGMNGYRCVGTAFYRDAR